LSITFNERRLSEISGSPLDGLLLLLRRLDQRLEQALASARNSYGPEAEADPYHGLYMSPNDLTRWLSRGPCEPLLAGDENGPGEPLSDSTDDYCSRLAWLARTYGLSSFDLDLILIALAPELDLRYERVYAYIQDDVTRRRPSVDLSLNLLCSSASAKLMRRAHFASDAPLIRNWLLQLFPDPNQFQPPLLAHYLKLDEQIVHLLLEQKSLDTRLSPFCRIVEADGSLAALPISADMKRALPALVARAREDCQPLKLYFHGPRGAGKQQTVEALAVETGSRLLLVDVARALAASLDFNQTVKLIFREAQFQDAILYLDSLDALRVEERSLPYQQLLMALDEDQGITILAGEQPRAPLVNRSTKVFDIHFPVQDFAQRRGCWDDILSQHGIKLDAGEVDVLAGRFRLTHSEIAATVVAAADRTRWREVAHSSTEAPPDAQLTVSDLFACARQQFSHNLASLAHKIEPRYTWDDIVVPPDQLSQLKEICDQAAYRHIVYSEWGFDRKLSLGKGINTLFSGPPGTGKTMAAEVIAGELHLDLYKIDLSQVVSKYIGETEKNLDRIFREAQASFSILFFDEADALFGKRSEVKDAHDRYANIEVGYLLQKMEEYDGIAILATNLRQHMDDAFVRRMQVIIEFPFPNEQYRREIWKVMFPPEAPLADDLDFDLLARDIRLAGGNIKNIALAAAFYAAGDGRVIRMPHLIQAARREFQKMGRTWTEAEGSEQRSSIS
jgi:ATP-dependent 26S proteasome regulatory subunit